MAARGLCVLGNYSVSCATSPAHHITQYLFIEQILFDKSSSSSSVRDIRVEPSEGFAVEKQGEDRDGLNSRSPKSSPVHERAMCTKMLLAGGTGNTVGKVVRLKAEGVGKRRPSLIGTRSSCPPALLAKERGGPTAPCASFVGNDPFT